MGDKFSEALFLSVLWLNKCLASSRILGSNSFTSMFNKDFYTIALCHLAFIVANKKSDVSLFLFPT